MKILNLILIFILLNGCASRMMYKKENYNGEQLINKNLLIIPINLSVNSSGFFENVKLTNPENEMLEFNKAVLKLILEKFKKFKINIFIENFNLKNTQSFDTLWNNLKLNQKNKLSIQEFSKINYNEIEKFLKNQNRSDFVLIYRINYFNDTSEKQIATKLSYSLLVIGGIATLNPSIPPPPKTGNGILEFILLDRITKKIVLTGEIENFYKEDEKVLDNSIERFLNYILEYRKNF